MLMGQDLDLSKIHPLISPAGSNDKLVKILLKKNVIDVNYIYTRLIDMGCANSMPLMNGKGGMVDAAKNAVNDTMHAGEEVLHDVGESINEAAVSVKEAVIGAVKSIGTGVDDVANNAHEAEHKIVETMKTNQLEHMENDENGEPLCKTIPLKDSNSVTIDDDLDDFKDMLSQMVQDQSLNDDEINKTSMNAVDDLEKDTKNKIVESVQEFTELEMSDKTPTHSLDSLKTSTPEPEIINAMLNDTYKSAPSPKPTLAEMKSIEEMDELLNNEKL